jgi:hypothetical protein
MACAMFCLAGEPEGVHGHVFRHNGLGLTFTFPERFSAKVESQLPMWKSTGPEHLILSLWTEGEDSPRLAFLYDATIRPADRSSAEIANRYLNAIRQMWVNVKGVKIDGPHKVAMTGFALWRVDLYQPESVPHYNAAIVIPRPDRTLLVIRAIAPSQSELDAEVDCLQGMLFDTR